MNRFLLSLFQIVILLVAALCLVASIELPLTNHHLIFCSVFIVPSALVMISETSGVKHV